MVHKGVEYMVAPTATPGIWKWQFRIGDLVKTGWTETRINLLAMRRVQLRINRELKKTERPSTHNFTGPAHPSAMALSEARLQMVHGASRRHRSAAVPDPAWRGRWPGRSCYLPPLLGDPQVLIWS